MRKETFVCIALCLLFSAFSVLIYTQSLIFTLLLIYFVALSVLSPYHIVTIIHIIIITLSLA